MARHYWYPCSTLLAGDEASHCNCSHLSHPPSPEIAWEALYGQAGNAWRLFSHQGREAVWSQPRSIS